MLAKWNVDVDRGIGCHEFYEMLIIRASASRNKCQSLCIISVFKPQFRPFSNHLYKAFLDNDYDPQKICDDDYDFKAVFV